MLKSSSLTSLSVCTPNGKPMEERAVKLWICKPGYGVDTELLWEICVDKMLWSLSLKITTSRIEHIDKKWGWGVSGRP